MPDDPRAVCPFSMVIPQHCLQMGLSILYLDGADDLFALDAMFLCTWCSLCVSAGGPGIPMQCRLMVTQVPETPSFFCFFLKTKVLVLAIFRLLVHVHYELGGSPSNALS